MICTPLTKRAYKIAFEAHRDQLDKTGLPYIQHPLHLAFQMTDEVTTCVALLHDVVEDSDMTFEELEKLGFGGEIMDALRLLTHADDVPYMDYVREIKKNPVAAAVKRADLMHNSDMTRLDVVTEKDLQRAEKYKKALEILSE
ncbi:MAG: HD domain-containing protein [Oscillospiraceae bacterium]|nr:HD domain-containing protein [Oscillospiraceae bacterium]